MIFKDSLINRYLHVCMLRIGLLTAAHICADTVYYILSLYISDSCLTCYKYNYLIYYKQNKIKVIYNIYVYP